MSKCTNNCRYRGETIGVIGFIMLFMTCAYSADSYHEAEEINAKIDSIEHRLDSIFEVEKPDILEIR